MQSKPAAKPQTVLYVEDEETDAFLMCQAFAQVAPDLELKILTHGQEAVKYLSAQGGYSDRELHPLPALVLLDLNLPVLSGFELLGWIRQQPGLKTLPVVVFSSSVRPMDKQKADELGANAYLEKPNSARKFREVAEQLKVRWLPGRTGGGATRGRPVPRMKKLIRSTTSKAFLTESGGWTTDCSRAQVFPTIAEAKYAALKHGLKAVELYYLLSDQPSAYDFTISLLR